VYVLVFPLTQLLAVSHCAATDDCVLVSCLAVSVGRAPTTCSIELGALNCLHSSSAVIRPNAGSFVTSSSCSGCGNVRQAWRSDRHLSLRLPIVPLKCPALCPMRICIPLEQLCTTVLV